MARGKSDIDTWTDGSIVEFEVKCGRCGRDITSLSAYVTLKDDGFAWEIELGRDYDHTQIRTGRSFPSSKDQKFIDEHLMKNNRWTLVCPGRRCGYRRTVLPFPTIERAMVRAWRNRTHALTLGIDF